MRITILALVATLFSINAAQACDFGGMSAKAAVNNEIASARADLDNKCEIKTVAADSGPVEGPILEVWTVEAACPGLATAKYRVQLRDEANAFGGSECSASSVQKIN